MSILVDKILSEIDMEIIVSISFKKSFKKSMFISIHSNSKISVIIL